MPASVRAGKLFGAYFAVVLQGEGSFLIWDVSGGGGGRYINALPGK